MTLRTVGTPTLATTTFLLGKDWLDIAGASTMPSRKVVVARVGFPTAASVTGERPEGSDERSPNAT